MKKIFLYLIAGSCLPLFCISQNVGIGTTAPTARLHIADSNVVFAAPYAISSDGNPPLSGPGRRMMWYADKAAFRTGAVSSDVWDKDSVGLYSFAAGIDAMAKGYASFAGGVAKARGIGSFAYGSGIAIGDLSVALGSQTVSRGVNSFASGYLSAADGDYSIAMGYRPIASGANATAIGYLASASGDYSIALGGASTADANTVAIGNGAVAAGFSSTAIGEQNAASGSYSFAVGYHNHSNGDYSGTLGSYAYTNFHTGSFVISGRTDGAVVTSTADHQIMMDFAGGYVFWSGPSGQGVYLGPNQNSWSSASDIRLKENFLHVDGEDVLIKIASFNLTSWNYKKTDPLIYRHYGPMAQDFFNAFGKDAIGTIGNDTTINQQDFLGINLIAIQALEKRTQKIEQQQQQIEILQKENTDLKARMERLEKMILKN